MAIGDRLGRDADHRMMWIITVDVGNHVAAMLSLL
jgi:hypothetical protein